MSKISANEYAAEYRKNNRAKIRAAANKWYHANKDKARRYSRKSQWKTRLGVDLDQKGYERLAKSQNNKCAICRDVCSSGKNLAVDHCHTIGMIRGLLCGNCNRGLGMFKDKPSLLQRAVAYLEENKTDE